MFLFDGGSDNCIGGIYQELEFCVVEDVVWLYSDQFLVWLCYVYLCYFGQGFEIKVDLFEGFIVEDYIECLKLVFYEVYECNFGYCDELVGIEVVDWYLVVVILVSVVSELMVFGVGDQNFVVLEDGEWQVYFVEFGGFVLCCVVSCYCLILDEIVVGLVIIEE